MDEPLQENSLNGRNAGVFQGVTMHFRQMYKDSKELRSEVKQIQRELKSGGVCKIDLVKIYKEEFYSPQDKTMYEQPAIFVVSMAQYRNIAKKTEINTFVGHSLGEYAAICAGGVISLEDGFRITQRRGLLVRKANIKNPGLMAAISGNFDLAQIRAICEEREIDIANINSPEQIVISGDIAGVRSACTALERSKGLRITPLETGGAFHSRKLEPVKERFREFLDTVPFNPPSTNGREHSQVFMNATARPETDPESIKDCLTNQLSSPVDFPSTIEALDEAGVDNIYEVGHGNILTNFIRRILRKRP